MEDLSLHILDIVENSLTAAATEIWILIDEDTAGDRLVLEIRDDGKGMDREIEALTDSGATGVRSYAMHRGERA